MNKYINLIKIILFLSLMSFPLKSFSSSLVGYWHNWNDFSAPYIHITRVDTSYNVIAVAFALPVYGTTYNMTFQPDVVSQQLFIQQVDSMKQKGNKVIISIGGATAQVILNDSVQTEIFVSSMMNIINTYGFDGIDIDLEGNSVLITGGTIANPVDARIKNLISAIKKIMINFRNTYNRKLILTMAPETAYVQGGMSAYGSVWGAYLPVIHALRDSIDILHVQLYNSGSMYGIDGNIYYQGTADFIISQTEAVIHGFNTAGGYFYGLRPDQVAVGLPACSSAAGGGYTHPDTVKAAINYLLGRGPKPARYTLVSSYPSLRGMMTWSINWDANASCHPVYAYARNYDRIFKNPVTQINSKNHNIKDFVIFNNYPNPFNSATKVKYSVARAGNISLVLYDVQGREVKKILNAYVNKGVYELLIDMKNLPSGDYFLKMQSANYSVSEKIVYLK